MNSDVRRFFLERAADIRAHGGEKEHRCHALQNLRLKTVVKESHCSPIQQIVYNRADPEMARLFATIGKDQVTVYDDSHMGHYISLVVHFTNEKTEFSTGGDVTCAAWMDGRGWTEHPHGDALLAFGGVSGEVCVISVVEARVMSLLKGSTKPIAELCGVPNTPAKLLAMSKDGEVRLWDADQEQCETTISTTGSCLAVHPSGSHVVVGGRGGAIQCWAIQHTDSTDQAGRLQLVGEGAVKVKDWQHTDSIACMRFLPNGRLVVRSLNGTISINDWEHKLMMHSWKVPGCSSVSGGIPCGIETTLDGEYLAAGSPSGQVYVYSTHDGKRMCHCEPIRVSGPVKTTALSVDCTHVLAARGNGFLFEFKYRKPKPEAAEDKENIAPAVMEEDAEGEGELGGEE